MSAIKLDKFGGMLPSWNDLLLPEGQASLSVNCYLFSGSLIGWRQPKLLHVLNNSAAKFVYRIPNRDSNNTSITAADSFWLELPDADSTVVRSPIVNDTFQRYYVASPSDVPKYNTYDRIIGGQPFWLLGVPGSGCSPGVTISGGGSTIQYGFPTTLPDGGGAVLCLTDDIEPFGFEQGARVCAEAGVVVDDEHGGHAQHGGTARAICPYGYPHLFRAVDSPP